MKILMVCSKSFLELGGIEKHVKEISERMVKDGEEVTVLCIDSKIKKIKEEKINGIRIIRCPGFAPNGNYHFSWQLYKMIKELDYDIIHCHGYNSLTTPLAILANNKKKKCIVNFHSAGIGGSLTRRILHFPYSTLMSLLKNKVDKFIFVSEFEKNLFSKKLRLKDNKMVIISNGLDFEEFKGLNRLKANPNLIISIGRLEKAKGFQEVIKGFAEAHKSNLKLKLEILGKGNYENELRLLVKKLNLEKAIVIQYLERKDMLKHLAKAKTFMLLSDYEAQPITVLEALFLKKRIILNNVGVLKEFVNAKLAIGVDKSKIKEIAMAIKNEKELTKNIKLLSWNEIVRLILEEYKK